MKRDRIDCRNIKNILKIILFMVLLCGLHLSGGLRLKAQDSTTKALLNEMIEKYKNMKSISYSAQYSRKSLFRNDTCSVSGQCKLIKDASDTIYNGYMLFKGNSGGEIFYDMNKTYFIMNTSKAISIALPSRVLSFIKGNFSGNLTQTFFFEIQMLSWLFKDSTNRVTVSTDTQNGKEYWKIFIKEADFREMTEAQKTLWVNKEDKTFEMMRFIHKIQGDYQYEEYILTDVKCNSVSIKELTDHLDSLKKIYEVSEFVESTQKKKELLQPGTSAPVFSGSTFDKVINIDFKGKKLYLLDFWYLSCGACIMALPHIVKLYQDFADKGLEIFGINSTDDRNKKKDMLEKFIVRNKITYPVIFIDKTVDSLYNVHAYPSLYLIDSNGKIVYSEKGFLESRFDSLRAIICKELGIEECQKK